MLRNGQLIFQAPDLLWEWTSRNIRARYQQSVLGWLWAIIQPAAQVAIFTTVFTLIVPIDTGEIPYILFAYVAIVPWTLLATALPDMNNSLVENMGLITKIYFPREVLPIAALLARLLDFLVATVLIVVLMVIFQGNFSPAGLLFLPLILLIQLLLMVGVGLITAALNVFYRDIRSLLVLGIQVWFYASPIIYPTSLVPDWLQPFYFLNPMAGIITAYRDVLLYNQLPGQYLWIAALTSAIICFIGFFVFKRVEFRFADIV